MIPKCEAYVLYVRYVVCHNLLIGLWMLISLLLLLVEIMYPTVISHQKKYNRFSLFKGSVLLIMIISHDTQVIPLDSFKCGIPQIYVVVFFKLLIFIYNGPFDKRT